MDSTTAGAGSETGVREGAGAGAGAGEGAGTGAAAGASLLLVLVGMASSLIVAQHGIFVCGNALSVATRRLLCQISFEKGEKHLSDSVQIGFLRACDVLCGGKSGIFHGSGCTISQGSGRCIFDGDGSGLFL